MLVAVRTGQVHFVCDSSETRQAQNCILLVPLQVTSLLFCCSHCCHRPWTIWRTPHRPDGPWQKDHVRRVFRRSFKCSSQTRRTCFSWSSRTTCLCWRNRYWSLSQWLIADHSRTSAHLMHVKHCMSILSKVPPT